MRWIHRRLAPSLRALIASAPFLICVHAARAEVGAPPSPPSAPVASDETDASDEPVASPTEDLRERLTERENKRRPLEPWRFDVLDRPLTISGQYEVFLSFIDQIEIGDPPHDAGRLLLEQEFEVEAFYSFGPPLSLFAQVRVGMAEDLDSDTPDGISDVWVERGEMWLYAQDLLVPGLSFEIGRLNFEDDRLWWWDVDLDAVRVSYETGPFEAVLSAAFEVGASQSDLGIVEPENDDVFRVLAEVTWDFRPDHTFELFALYQDDGSGVEDVGERVARKRQDESDARLTWIGGRLMGAWDTQARGIFGYWIDAAYVRGDQTLVELEEVSRRESVVVGTQSQRVSGWAVDVGATWILPVALEPRFTLGYAIASGDRDPASGRDRSFRQTTLQGNETGLGGVRRFPSYGVLLNPELSNLQIVTVDFGLSLFEASSLDLVYHHYRQVEPADFLRDSNVDETLTGRSRCIGHGFDLVLAIQESSWFELDLVGSVFRTGSAFGRDSGEWIGGAIVGVTLVF